MIVGLEGKQVSWNPNSRDLVISCNGVWYAVSALDFMVTSGVPKPGASIKVIIHQQVRETGISLFGFKDHDELELFRVCLKAPKIGGKTALAAMLKFPEKEMRRIVEGGSYLRFVEVPGIAEPTAEAIYKTLKAHFKRKAA